MELLPVDVRAGLSGLRLIARRATASGALGQHLSRTRGAGLEFAQYRAYEPGDEPRRIDWKLYARSDRYFVRESERDSQLTLWLLIDATASMAQADLARPEWRKLDAARVLAAAMIEVAVRQGDAFGLVIVSGEGLRFVPPGTGPRHRDRCWVELQRARASGACPDDAVLRPLWERVGAGAMVLSLSDDFDPAWIDLLERLASTRREVLSIQVLGGDEREFPFRGGFRFRDPETGAEIDADAPGARRDFLAQFGAAREQLARRLAAVGIRHETQWIDRSLLGALRRLFGARGAQALDE